MDIREVDARYGRMKYLATDAWVATSLALYREYSEHECAFWRTLIEPGDTVITAGANIGAHVLFFARQVGPTGRVFAFEPQAALAALCLGNVMENDVDEWVKVEPAALGAREGTIKMPRHDYAGVDNYGAVSVGEGEVDVPVWTIDSLQVAPKLIHLDVEGHELDALEGAAETILAWRPYLYLEADRRDVRGKLLRWLDEHRYCAAWHLPPLFNETNFAGAPPQADVFRNVVSVNVFAYPR